MNYESQTNMPSQPPTSKDALDVFVEEKQQEFEHYFFCHKNLCESTYCDDRDKDFLTTTLAEYKALIVKEIEGKLPEERSLNVLGKQMDVNWGYNACLSEVKGIIKNI